MSHEDTVDTRGDDIRYYQDTIIMRKLGLGGEPLDLSNEEHRHAWAFFEALREMDLGNSYKPLPVEQLILRRTARKGHAYVAVRNDYAN